MRKANLLWTTCLAILCLGATVDHESLNRTLKSIASAQQDNGAWPTSKGKSELAPRPTSLAVKVLAMNDVDRARVNKGIAFLLRDQRADGSWSNDPADTAFAILAISQARRDRANVDRAGDYLRRSRDLDNGFWREGANSMPSIVSTAVVLDALKAADYTKKDTMVSTAVVWLTTSQNRDGGYGVSKGLPSATVSTAWSVIALSDWGYDPTLAEVGKASGWLVKNQKPSGGFSAEAVATEDPETTALAAMALERIPGQAGAVRKALDYLSRYRLPDGSFGKEAGRKDIQTTCFVAWALSGVK